MLVPALAVEAELFQARAHFGAGLAVLLRQTKAQSAIGVAELEALDQLGMHKPALLQIVERLRRLLQRVVIIADDLVQQRLVIGFEPDRRGQPARRRRRKRRWRVVAAGAVLQQFHGMAKAHALALHGPLNHVARRIAAKAMEEVLLGAHGQRRLVVLVEGAKPDQLLAVLLQGNS